MGSAFWLTIQNIILLGTLGAVLWQLIQVRRTTRRDAMLRAVEDHDRVNELLLQYPQLNRFIDPHGNYAGWPRDEDDFATLLTLALGRFERLYMFQREGVIDKALWDSWVRWVKNTWLAGPISQKVWDLEGQFYSLPFQKFINRLIDESASLPEVNSMALTLREALELYENGKHRRYALLFSVNGGAFAVAKILKSEGNVLGGLSLKELSIGMALFSAVMVVDVFAFGLRSKREPIPNVFNGVGQAVVILLGALICVGWLLVGFG